MSSLPSVREMISRLEQWHCLVESFKRRYFDVFRLESDMYKHQDKKQEYELFEEAENWSSDALDRFQIFVMENKTEFLNAVHSEHDKLKTKK
jgi:hypothetical protein